MIPNFLATSLRNLRKQGSYSVINIAGLAIGLASALFIFLYIEYESRYDRFLPNAGKIYKVHTERTFPTRKVTAAITHIPMAETLVKEFAEVKQATRLSDFGTPVLVSVEQSKERTTYEERAFYYADSNFFSVLPFNLLKGDPKSALALAGNLVLTEKLAIRYFNTQDVLGKKLRVDTTDYIVTGVMQNVPDNSHFKFDLLAASQTLPYWQTFNFRSLDVHTYIELADETDVATLQSKLTGIADRYVAPQVEESLGVTWADYKKAGNGYRYLLTSLHDLHTDSTPVEYKQKPGTSKVYLYLLGGIAILVVVVACINFINLATAYSSQRAKEVGIRKTLGSAKIMLIAQFLLESVLLNIAAFLVTSGILYLLLPEFNNLVHRSLSLNWATSNVFKYGILFAFLPGLLAGIYPALVLSSFNPVQVLKGNFQTSSRGATLRKMLVVFQLFISTVLIIAVVTLYKQLQHIQNLSLGFDKHNQIVIPYVNRLDNLNDALAERMRLAGGVSNASLSLSVPGINFFGFPFTPEGAAEAVTSRFNSIDDHYADVMGLEILEGRSFGEIFNDSLSIILNEAAIKAAGLTDPIGKKISYTFYGPNGTSAPQVIQFEIVGVVRNFNYNSLHENITPLCLVSKESAISTMNFLTIKVESVNEATIKNIEAIWKELVPEETMQYSFLETSLDKLYASEQTTAKMLLVFASLTIMISCIGLLGLAAYSAQIRKKEIGVRKVIGATTIQVVMLQLSEFIKLIGIAFAVSIPVAWFILNAWLNNFAYRIDLGVDVFLLAAIITTLVTLTSVLYQALRAAIANPITSIRNE